MMHALDLLMSSCALRSYFLVSVLYLCQVWLHHEFITICFFRKKGSIGGDIPPRGFSPVSEVFFFQPERLVCAYEIVIGRQDIIIILKCRFLKEYELP